MKVLVLTLLACVVAVIQPVEAQLCKCIHMYIVLVYKNKAYFEPIWFHDSLFLLQLMYHLIQEKSTMLKATLPM